MNEIKGWLAELDWRKIGFGTGVALVAMLTMTAAAAGCMEREWIPLGWMGYAAALIMVLSGFTGAGMAGGGINGIAVGLCMIVVLLGLNAAVFGASVEGFWASILPIIGGCGAAGLLLARGRSRGGSRRRKRKNR